MSKTNNNLSLYFSVSSLAAMSKVLRATFAVRLTHYRLVFDLAAKHL